MRKTPGPTRTLKIAAIAASIKEWGWTTPALVGEDGGLIAGPRQDTRRPAARHRRDPRDGGRGLERGAKARRAVWTSNMIWRGAIPPAVDRGIAFRRQA